MTEIITYSTLKKFVEKTVGKPLNTDIFWGSHEIVVYPQSIRRVHFKLLNNLGRTSTRRKPHKKDNGNMLKMDMVRKLVLHFQETKVFPTKKTRVIPG
jgi:hypothetical protein